MPWIALEYTSAAGLGKNHSQSIGSHTNRDTRVHTQTHTNTVHTLTYTTFPCLSLSLMMSIIPRQKLRDSTTSWLCVMTTHHTNPYGVYSLETVSVSVCGACTGSRDIELHCMDFITLSLIAASYTLEAYAVSGHRSKYNTAHHPRMLSLCLHFSSVWSMEPSRI